MKAISDVAKDALELSPNQRIVLARILLDLSEESVPGTPDVEEEWDAEIYHRMKAVEAGSARSKSFEEVFADLDRRFPS